jgi:chemotaxis protein methyltransferase CheR
MITDRQDQTNSPWRGETLHEVVDVIRQVHGVDVSCYEESFLVKSLEKRRQATAVGTAAGYIAHLAQERTEAEALCRSLRISYSEFFRSPLDFALLEQFILPDLVEKSVRKNCSELRVWSAGCATGEEAWSVAILLDEMASAREHAVPFRIFATDRLDAQLAFARKGVYGASTLGNVRLRHLQRGFSQQGESFAVVPRIKARVDFSAYDLLDKHTSCPPASIYGHFDLVVCCNVLLYYRQPAKRFILNKVGGCLASGRYLMIGETERQIVEDMDGFRSVNSPASLYQRIRETAEG